MHRQGWGTCRSLKSKNLSLDCTPRAFQKADKTPKSNEPAIYLKSAIYIDVKNSIHASDASVFLGVILLGMNKPRPWKCPWTSSKKRKKRTKNENTAMNEQAKVDGKLKLRLSGIRPAKDRVESFN